MLVLDGDPGAVAEPLIRQRQRMVAVLDGLTDDEWSHPSRCDGWSARDVAVHLASTNAFWEFSIRSGIDGAPTEILASFDPVASPAQMVAGSAMTTDEVVESFATSTASLVDLLGGLTAADWEASAEAPPGHVSVSAVAHHALWDSWIHERDILVPIGRTPDEVADEVMSGLRYVAGLTPALALNGGASGSSAFDVSGSDPDIGFHVAVHTDVRVHTGTAGSDFELVGGSVDLLEALSFRCPLEQEIPEELDWVFSGLHTVFDR